MGAVATGQLYGCTWLDTPCRAPQRPSVHGSSRSVVWSFDSCLGSLCGSPGAPCPHPHSLPVSPLQPSQHSPHPHTRGPESFPPLHAPEHPRGKRGSSPPSSSHWGLGAARPPGPQYLPPAWVPVCLPPQLLHPASARPSRRAHTRQDPLCWGGAGARGNPGLHLAQRSGPLQCWTSGPGLLCGQQALSK